MEDQELLRAYDSQLREASEFSTATAVRRDGPLWIGRYGDRGHVSYRDLQGLSGDELESLVARTVQGFLDDPRLSQGEWKTRGHDLPSDLPEVLVAAGFVPEPRETVMVGEAEGVAALAHDSLPDEVEVLRVDQRPDAERWVLAAARMQHAVFGSGPEPDEALAGQDARAEGEEFWVARVGTDVVGAGRVQRVAGTEFASLWGGAVDPAWRGRGLYRALASGRAKAAARAGARYLHSDCSDMSRPILERAGLRPITTTTPYVWTRAGTVRDG
ncbi:GNAT family N-acetyltransferase [Nocardioides jishulii]|uniref:GNAT family N-acetyltransferase n=1 Tax=Nocardioides jishulii TaxID=2575440 RepID=UPI001BAEA367|nr:GNAT family N-acetyltransferase [Nocardioides jishulii]